jgi:sulfopyruvate decarboxylase TPP-binding subunit
VPDIVTSKSLLVAVSQDPAIHHIKVCKEDEGIGISAGLSFCGKRALLLIQSTGLLDSINALKAAGLDYNLPICMMVGLVQREPDRRPRDSASWGVRVVEPILDAMTISHQLLETESDASLIAPAIHNAYRTPAPTVLLIGRPPRIQR